MLTILYNVSFGWGILEYRWITKGQKNSVPDDELTAVHSPNVTIYNGESN